MFAFSLTWIYISIIVDYTATYFLPIPSTLVSYHSKLWAA